MIDLSPFGSMAAAFGSLAVDAARGYWTLEQIKRLKIVWSAMKHVFHCKPSQPCQFCQRSQ